MLRVFLTWSVAGAGLVLLAFAVASAVFLESEANSTSAAGSAPPAVTAVSEVGGATQAPAPAVTVLAVTTSQPQPSATTPPGPTTVPQPTPQAAGPVVPGRPSGLTATVASQGVGLTWQPAPGAGYYNIYRSEVPGGGLNVVYVALGSTGGPSWVDTTAQRGVTYYYVVTASGGGIESAISNEASIQLP